jgi:hypothetical protein
MAKTRVWVEKCKMGPEGPSREKGFNNPVLGQSDVRVRKSQSVL